MDALWYLRHRRGGGRQGPWEWEFSAGVDKWDQVSAPGQLGKRLVEGFLGREAPDRWARTTQNLMHWATGVGWGTAFGVVAGSARRPSWKSALALAPVAWLVPYTVLPASGIYRPIWEYDATTLAKDASAHGVFGAVAAAVALALIGRR
jgi:hypothetical protein